MNAVADENLTSPVFACDGSRLAGIDPAKLVPHDFRKPSLITQTDLGLLETVHRQFATRLSARLSMFLRMECTVTPGECAAVPFSEFARGVTDPAFLTLFQIEPWRGVPVLDTPVRFAAAIADRLLGGKGRGADGRALTEIEQTLFEDAADIIMKEWTAPWPSTQPLTPRLIGHESSAQFLQTSAPDAVTVVARFEATLGETKGTIILAIPHSMIEPSLREMRSARERKPQAGARLQWRSPYDSIPVAVDAEWDVRQTTLRAVAAFEVGTVIELSPELIHDTRIRMSGRTEFIGTVGTENGRVAIEITRPNS